MREHSVGCLPVLEGRELVAMVTDHDLVVRGLAELTNPSHPCVGDVMSAGALSCLSEHRIDDVRRVMTEKGITRLPVISRRGRPVGVLLFRDIAGRVPRPGPRRVVLYKRMANSLGRRHAVEISKVNLSPGIGREDAGAAAIRRFERDHGGRPWKLLADEHKVAEGA